MKVSTLIRHLSLGVAAATVTSAAFAMHSPQHERDAPRYGMPAPAAAATRTVNLHMADKYLNVYDGETITVVKDGKSFTWRFSSISQTPFALEVVAPKDFAANDVRVYLTADPNRVSIN